MERALVRPRRRWYILVLILTLSAAEIDAAGTCGCDDFAPRVSSIRSFDAVPR